MSRKEVRRMLEKIEETAGTELAHTERRTVEALVKPISSAEKEILIVGDLDKNERRGPLNWPNNIPLPTIEEVREVGEGYEEAIRERQRALRGRLEGSDPDMLKTIVDI